MSNCVGKSANKSKKDGAIRKSTCRKSLMSAPSTKGKNQEGNATRRTFAGCTSEKQNVKENGGTNLHERRYNTPQMNTILRDVNQMKHVETLQPPLYKKDADLTPRSKAAIAPKVTQRLNFNADQVIYKNLTPLNVNDSILIQKPSNANPNKFQKLNKVPAPELCHWLERQPALKFTIPEPDLMLEFCETKIDPFKCYLNLLN